MKPIHLWQGNNFCTFFFLFTSAPSAVTVADTYIDLTSSGHRKHKHKHREQARDSSKHRHKKDKKVEWLVTDSRPPFAPPRLSLTSLGGLLFAFAIVFVGWLKCCFTSTETIGLLGTGAQDGHLDFHTAPELCLHL